MNATEKKRINALDILLILVVVLLIVAFFFRAEIRNLFARKGDVTITFSFVLDSVDETLASRFAAGTVLTDGDGKEIGTVLEVGNEPSVTQETLTDGTVIGVPNGRRTLTCSVTAKGYVSGDYRYLNTGAMLVEGGTLGVSTGTAYAEVRILHVQTQ